MRRSPGQTVFLAAVVVTGILIGTGLWRQAQERAAVRAAAELPDLELRDLSADELFAREDFRGHAHSPRSWDRISLRHYAEPDGSYQRFLRCRIDGDEVPLANRQLMRHPGRRATVDGLPPSWWPDEPDPPWARPEWWQPAPGGQSLWYAEQLDSGMVLGAFCSYEPDTGWMHYWEWRRPDILPPPGPDHLHLDELVAQLIRRLVSERHPVDGAGWLRAPGVPASQLALLPAQLPPGLRSIDCWARPQSQALRWLVALHGLDEEVAAAVLGNLPVAAIADDGAPPVEDWAQALPSEGLPPWFRVGTGPRWHYLRVQPGTGLPEVGRWAGYDRERRVLFVWDWQDGT